MFFFVFLVRFLGDHPGGSESIKLAAGEDATDDFMGIHSSAAKKQLADYVEYSFINFISFFFPPFTLFCHYLFEDEKKLQHIHIILNQSLMIKKRVFLN